MKCLWIRSFFFCKCLWLCACCLDNIYMIQMEFRYIFGTMINAGSFESIFSIQYSRNPKNAEILHYIQFNLFSMGQSLIKESYFFRKIIGDLKNAEKNRKNILISILRSYDIYEHYLRTIYDKYDTRFRTTILWQKVNCMLRVKSSHQLSSHVVAHFCKF